MTTLDRDELMRSARDFASRALQAYIEDDVRVILINAAFSLEHLSKAFLYSQHPALLVELRNGHFDALLHLTGLGHRARKLKVPRTVSAREALARVEQLTTLRTPRTSLEQLIDVRDGVVHVGYLDPANTREILTAFVRFSNELYEKLQIEEDIRWGDHASLVTSLISESLSEIEHEVQRKVEAAKRRVGELMSKIPRSEQEAVGDARQAMAPIYSFLAPEPGVVDSPHRIYTPCPACNHPDASCLGYLEWDFEPLDRVKVGPLERLEDVIGQEEYFRPTDLVCGSCDLHLESADELQVVGIPLRFVFGGDDSHLR
ncbi:hypothetical protein AB0G05_19885 [Nonomuraea wenchangensis]